MKIVKMEVCEAIINMMEVAGIEPSPSNSLQAYEILSFYLTLNTLMGQI